MTPRFDINANTQTTQIGHMLAMQNRLNGVVHPQWASAGFNWTRAILDEGVELLGHYNRWKWWKKNTTPDLPQCQLELVDIWHFALSYWMVRFGITDARDWVLLEAVSRRVDAARAKASKPASGISVDEDFNRCVEALVGAAAGGTFDTDAFFHLCHLVGLDFDTLYRMYVGKNVLNTFRQHYGYKSGHYLKNWFGKEDNDALVQVLAEHSDKSGEAFEQAVLDGLLQTYTRACSEQNWCVVDIDGAPVLGRRMHVQEKEFVVGQDGQAVALLPGEPGLNLRMLPIKVGG